MSKDTIILLSSFQRINNKKEFNFVKRLQCYKGFLISGITGNTKNKTVINFLTTPY